MKGRGIKPGFYQKLFADLIRKKQAASQIEGQDTYVFFYGR